MAFNILSNVTRNITIDDFNVAVGCGRNPIGRLIGSLITILITLILILGNFCTILVSFQDQSLRLQVGNLLLIYQSSLDILRGLFVMLPSAISVAYDYWPFGSEICKFHSFFNYMSGCSLSVNLALTGVERAIAMIYRLRYLSVMTRKGLLKGCVFVFILSFTVASACALSHWTRFNCSEAVCAMEYKMGSGVYHVFNLSCVVCYYMPIAILIMSYTMTSIADRELAVAPEVFFIRRHTATFYRECLERDNHVRMTIKSLIVVAVTHYVCLAPYAFIKQAEIYLQIYIPPELYYFSTVFIYISSAANPLIYAIFGKDYRNAFKRLLNCAD